MEKTISQASEEISMENKKFKKTTEMESRISQVPDELIHHIFSSMDMIKVVQTSVLSKRWRYIWLSLPTLNFDLGKWIQNCRSRTWKSKFKAFMKFVDKILSRRKQDSAILQLRLYTRIQGLDDHKGFDPQSITSWIEKVLKRQIQHLIAEFPDPIIVLPNVISAASMIRNLDLYEVWFPDGDVNGEFILSCKDLKDLRIDNCVVDRIRVLTIATPRLEKLYLRLYIARKELNEVIKVKVKVYASNLTDLTFIGYCGKFHFPVDCSIEDDLLSLVNADIFVGAEKRNDMMDECYRCMIKILPRLGYAQQVDLCIHAKQILTGLPVVLERIVPAGQFHNVRYLRLEDQIKASLHAILGFVQMFPHIETFVWHGTGGDLYLDNKVVHISQDAEESTNLLIQSIFTCLKVAGFYNLLGAEVEVEFLKFVLERAPLLKTMTNKYHKSLSGVKLSDFKKKVSSLQPASSDVFISVQPMPVEYDFWGCPC